MNRAFVESRLQSAGVLSPAPNSLLLNQNDLRSGFEQGTASSPIRTRTVECTLPSVTVIMPVYNEEPFIEKILTAVLGQDYPSEKLEIILADGRSTDKTREIICSIQKKHQNVQ